ncbi:MULTISPECIES: hypothetical protein [Rhodopseudomonas]|uniref:Uncharacterized protein n=1 Tax=Rhodopseudomonas palustris TaxID=1076 RepID=A0A0D7ELK0_RHOPL|nr:MULTISPECIES: hypothetical protein [Rhodopseudomonas]KIZ41425.1 hypothetical protein OO17_15070 [Rhodopseudomonas palustris]MDF3810072.1 hypothetical protein [Rhodopseudomonas sp. BAL398]WOK18749.1 hypothetical protein RBJ75_04255 [Rhodopseudomonas sp. BAL398]
MELPPVIFEAGPFSPAETVILTGITESTLQNWTNKGYLGADKVGLGRGAKRRYTLADIETIMFGMDMVGAGISPVVAFEYAPVVQRRTAEAVERIRDRLIEDGHSAASLQRDLSDQVVELLACFAANPDVGSSEDYYAVNILHGGKLQFQHLPDGKWAVMLLRVGLRKLGLASHLDAIKAAKQAKRAARPKRPPVKRMTEEELLAGLEGMDEPGTEKGKP